MNKHVLLAAFLCTYIVVAAQDPQANQAEDLFQMQTENGSLALDRDTTGHILAFLSRQDMRTFKETCKTGNQTIKKIQLGKLYREHKEIIEYMARHDFNAPLSGEGYSSDYKKDRARLFEKFAADPELFLVFFEKYPTCIFIRDADKASAMRLVLRAGIRKQGETFIKTFLNIAEKNEKKLLQEDTSDVVCSCMYIIYTEYESPWNIIHESSVVLEPLLVERMFNFVIKYEKTETIIYDFRTSLLLDYNRQLPNIITMMENVYQIIMNSTGSLSESWLMKSEHTMKIADNSLLKIDQTARLLLKRDIKINERSLKKKICFKYEDAEEKIEELNKFLEKSKELQLQKERKITICLAALSTARRLLSGIRGE